MTISRKCMIWVKSFEGLLASSKCLHPHKPCQVGMLELTRPGPRAARGKVNIGAMSDFHLVSTILREACCLRLGLVKEA